MSPPGLDHSELDVEHVNKRHNLKRGRLGLVISSKRTLCEKMAGVHDKKRKKRKQPSSQDETNKASKANNSSTPSGKSATTNNKDENKNKNKNKGAAATNDKSVDDGGASDGASDVEAETEQVRTQADRMNDHETKSKAAKVAKRAKSEADALAGPRPGESFKNFTLRIGAEARHVINEQVCRDIYILVLVI
jgi:hypothetical protein